jgi:ATP-dependent DNA helicase RecG
MDQSALQQTLADLITTWENEVVEFKRGASSFSTDEIGKYFSALANEANLRGLEQGWLVFGVDDKLRQVVGSPYRPDLTHLHSLKQQIAHEVEPKMTFREIHVLDAPVGRILLMEIPAAPRGIPISFKGHYYARAGESLVSLGLDKLDQLRQQTLASDWSAEIVKEADLTHLDTAALSHARALFANKYANRFSVRAVIGWPVETFLERARLTREGKLTRTALLLLGKPEAVHLLSPHPAQITWKLEGYERAYAHFGPPFLLSTTALYQKIRNIQLRILPQDALLPVEVAKYDQNVLLEALHNCIAHQDYRRNGRIVVTELPEKLIFENEGGFFDGHPDDYTIGERTPRRYRNAFLSQAMVELNMIDTMGYGIHRMYLSQARRYLPMPDYDLSQAETVRITIYGNVVDPAYSRLLIQQMDMPLADILALDRIQKRLPVSDDMCKRLRRAGLIEGRKPNFYVSAQIAKATGTEAAYIVTRGQDDAFYAKLVTDFLTEFGSATRQQIDELLLMKLSDGLQEEQKRNKIANLLRNLRRTGLIRNAGTRHDPNWVKGGEAEI